MNTTSFGSEVDSYTSRPSSLKDATKVINRELNQMVDKAIATANEDSLKTPEKLYRILYDILGGKIFSKFEGKINSLSGIYVTKIPLDQSIYRDLSDESLPAIKLYRKLSCIFRIADFYIGTDKLGHFISQGYTCYKIAFEKEEGVENALAYSIKTELTYFGLLTTGIYSYADTLANFQGLRFWNFLLNAHEDPLGDNEHGPYIVLRDGRWTKIKNIDMRYYFDHGWDEHYNKNKYRNHRILDIVSTRINSVRYKLKIPKSKELQSLSAIQDKYRPYEEYIVNTSNALNVIDKEKYSLLAKALENSKKQ